MGIDEIISIASAIMCLVITIITSIIDVKKDSSLRKPDAIFLVS